MREPKSTHVLECTHDMPHVGSCVVLPRPIVWDQRNVSVTSYGARCTFYVGRLHVETGNPLALICLLHSGCRKGNNLKLQRHMSVITSTRECAPQGFAMSQVCRPMQCYSVLPRHSMG